MDINYKASATFKDAVHKLRPLVTAIRGPIGSGKSVGCVMHMLRISMEQEPNSEGIRKTRWVCIRNTYPDLKGTVIKTFQDWIPDSICRIKFDAPIEGKMNIPHPDGDTTIEAEFFFLSLDKPKDIQKLMSLECTGVWINEAQFLDKAIVLEALSRAGRYPSMKDGGPTWYGMIMDTNSPDEDHWWFEMEKGVDDDGNSQCPSNWEFIEQPGGLIEITGIRPELLPPEVAKMVDDGHVVTYLGKTFAANPLAENVANHKKGYGYWIEKVQGQTLSWIRSRLCNVFATVQHGKPIFGDHFNREIHVAKDTLLPIKGLDVFIGVDFGLTPAAIIGQLTPIGQLRILDEVVATGMGIERFAKEQLMPLLRTKYRGNKVTIIGDPAGVGRKDTDERTCFEILESLGFDAEPAPDMSNNPTARWEAVRWWMSQLVGKGHPAFLISPHCKVIIKANETGYQFKRLNVSGERYSDRADKNQYSHPADAEQYLCLSMLPQHQQQIIISNAAAFRSAGSAGY